MATRRFSTRSNELTNSILVRGLVAQTSERTQESGIIERNFELSNPEVLRGDLRLTGDSSLLFKGYTLANANSRFDVHLGPVLDLDNANFFDQNIGGSAQPAVLIVGGAEIQTPMGFAGMYPAVVGGDLDGEPVRAFLTTGADSSLADVLPNLIGFHGPLTLDIIAVALNEPHPIMAIDALAQAAWAGNADQAARLAKPLLQLNQPTVVKSKAIELLGHAISLADNPTILVELAISAWEVERENSLYIQYLRTLETAAHLTESASLRKQIADSADAPMFTVLSEIVEKLSQLEKTRASKDPK